MYVGLFKEERRGIGRVLEICVCVGSPKMPRKNWGKKGGHKKIPRQNDKRSEKKKKKKRTCSREKEKEKAKMVRGLQEAAKKKKGKKG